MAEPWDTLLYAWLHDPVDKTADIRSHESRALKYAAIVLGREVTAAELSGGTPDQLASAYERLPLPDAKGRYNELAVTPENGRLEVYHPLSAEREHIDLPLRCDETAEILKQIFCPLADADSRTRFLTLWRLTPERMRQLSPGYCKQPAETRNPDHTLWQHLDTTAAMAWALKKGSAAFLSFKLGPVQEFIRASRSLLDLHTSSWLLSHITFGAIEPILDSCGPTAFIYPALRGLPIMDKWLYDNGVQVPVPKPEDLYRASVPHRFLALVPDSLLRELQDQVRAAALKAWHTVADRVRRRLAREWNQSWSGWDRLWDDQVGNFWDIRTAGFSFKEANLEELLGKERVAQFAPIALLRGKLQAKWGECPAGFWQCMVEISATLMEASSTVRNIPCYRPTGKVPPKCTLFGTYEQMGPAGLAESDQFWKATDRFNEGRDRLSAIGLVKRYALRDHTIGIRFPEIQEVARRHEMCSTEGKKANYYATLMLDGDRMGGWLSGDNSPMIAEVLHPKIQRNHPDGEHSIKSILALKRPVSPALHMAISERLTRFAVEFVPTIVRNHKGETVYSGGDDVLAMLPTDEVLQCAQELKNAFSSTDVLGNRATVSAGIVIAHHKEDLRIVLRRVREAEQSAKRYGRNCVCIVAMRRSGEHAAATCSWNLLGQLGGLMEEFSNKASDRWTYQMRRELADLSVLPVKAFRNELCRQMSRSEERSRVAELVLETFDLFWREETERRADCGKVARPEQTEKLLEEFMILCQTASLLARVGEE